MRCTVADVDFIWCRVCFHAACGVHCVAEEAIPRHFIPNYTGNNRPRIYAYPYLQHMLGLMPHHKIFFYLLDQTQTEIRQNLGVIGIFVWTPGADHVSIANRFNLVSVVIV